MDTRLLVHNCVFTTVAKEKPTLRAKSLLVLICWAGCLLSWSGCQVESSNADQQQATQVSTPLPPEAVPPPEVGATFTDVSDAAGIGFTHSFGDDNFSNLVEAVGGGAAFLDYDQDGWVDLYLVSGKWAEGLSSGERESPQSINRLYRNRQDGTFEDVTLKARVGLEESFSMGVTVGDYDNDGYPDLYVANFGSSVLLHNEGNGTFRDVTSQAGVANSGLCSVAATWLDFDRDGLLDLYVSSYIDFDPDYSLYYAPDGFPGPMAYKGQPDRLYRNLGDSRFEDVSEQVGIAGLEGRGMSVASIDFDDNGYPDLYVTNDATENFLLKNEDGKHFSQIALESGVGYNGMGDSTASMGIDFGDYDQDGKVDLFVSDNSLSSLYKNEGDGLFMDVVVESGIALNSAQYVGWGSFFFDFDNDSDLDILKVNSDLSRLFGQEDQIFENKGEAQFEDISPALGEYFNRTLIGRGAAFADYDNDGDLDVIISNISGPAVLLRNDGGNRANWLQLDLVGTQGNHDGIGAKVQLTVGGKSLTGYRRANTGYLSTSDSRLHFGLGSATTVDKIEIIWPSGDRQTIEAVPANQRITIKEQVG
ncbi:MAG: CRTAC1 family protein [Acidobacteriota bacterium]|nr:MAG: CRTAC1 family protein [Acidobacteriota bacterium]